MDIKMKENVNVNSFTFKKRVIEEALELLGRKRNYLDNDLAFVTMICFVNNLVENNLIIETLYKEEDIEQKMYEIVEPLFKTEVLDKEENKSSFEDILQQVEEFMYREYESRLSMSGFAYDLMSDIGELKPEEFYDIVVKLVSSIPMRKTETKPEQPKQTDDEIKQDVLKDIENLKMKALIEKFSRENKEENAAE